MVPVAHDSWALEATWFEAVLPLGALGAMHDRRLSDYGYYYNYRLPPKLECLRLKHYCLCHRSALATLFWTGSSSTMASLLNMGPDPQRARSMGYLIHPWTVALDGFLVPRC